MAKSNVVEVWQTSTHIKGLVNWRCHHSYGSCYRDSSSTQKRRELVAVNVYNKIGLKSEKIYLLYGIALDLWPFHDPKYQLHDMASNRSTSEAEHRLAGLLGFSYFWKYTATLSSTSHVSRAIKLSSGSMAESLLRQHRQGASDVGSAQVAAGPFQDE